MRSPGRSLPALVAVALLASTAGGQATQVPTPACALLGVAELRQITGNAAYPDHVDGDAEGEGAGGGSSCQYGGGSFMPGRSTPMLSIVLIRGKNYTEATRKYPPRAGCKREDVAGVGQDAFFASCPDPKAIRSSPLYVKAGTNDLIVQLDIEPPATEATVRPIVIAIAKAAVKNLR